MVVAVSRQGLVLCKDVLDPMATWVFNLAVDGQSPETLQIAPI